MTNRNIDAKLLFGDRYASSSNNLNFTASQLSKIVPSLQYLDSFDKRNNFLAKSHSINLNGLKICANYMTPTRISSTDGSEYTLMIPIKGNCKTIVENKIFFWGENNFAFFKTNSGGKSEANQSRNSILIDLSPERFHTQAKIMLGDKLKNIFYDFENHGLIPLNFNGISFSLVFKQLCKIIDLNIEHIQNLEKAKFDELIYRTLVMMFLPENFFINENIKQTNKISTSTIKLIKEIENEDYFSFMSLTDLENFLDLSTRNLQLLFKKNFNITPTQFLREQKLKYAKKLILESNGNLTISQIALEIGFFNFSQFTKYYKEYHGVLPSETKKLIK